MEKAAKWPEAWVHPDTGHKLGIDEMDLIIISHAIERNLVLVTSDRLNRIRDGIRLIDIAFRTEKWAGTAGPPN